VKLQGRLEKEIDAAKNRQLDALDRANQKLRSDVRRARRMVGKLIKRLQDADKPTELPPQERIQEISEQLQALESKPAEVEHQLKSARDTVTREAVEARELRPGETIWTRSYEREANLLEVDAERKEAMIQLGLFKVRVPLDDLFKTEQQAHAYAAAAQPRKRSQRRGAGAQAQAQRPPAEERDAPLLPQTSENTCDLRGLRSDEAIERLDMFLDWAYRRELGAVYVIHGHGTGVLKRAVRDFTSSSRYVKRSRAGERGEGGDGVTVMWLR